MATPAPRVRLLWPLTVLLVLAALTAGCAVKLVPSYDKTILDGLTMANQATLELFASVSSGAPSASFAKRESKYNSLIGSFDALRIQAAARPVPRPLFFQWFNIGPASDKKPSEIEKFQNPTPDILTTVTGTLTRMRDADRSGRLSAVLVKGFKQSYEISIEQVLTFEKALER